MSGKKTLVFLLAFTEIVAILILAAFSWSIPLMAYAVVTAGVQISLFCFYVGWLERLEAKTIDTNFAAVRNTSQCQQSSPGQLITMEQVEALLKATDKMVSGIEDRIKKIESAGFEATAYTPKRGKPKKELTEEDKLRITEEIKSTNK